MSAKQYKVKAASFRAHLAELIRMVEASDRVIVMRHGEPVAALISLKDLELLKSMYTKPEATHI